MHAVKNFGVLRFRCISDRGRVQKWRCAKRPLSPPNGFYCVGISIEFVLSTRMRHSRPKASSHDRRLLADRYRLHGSCLALLDKHAKIPCSDDSTTVERVAACLFFRRHTRIEDVSVERPLILVEAPEVDVLTMVDFFAGLVLDDIASDLGGVAALADHFERSQGD